jgi:hypothetical protein
MQLGRGELERARGLDIGAKRNACRRTGDECIDRDRIRAGRLGAEPRAIAVVERGRPLVRVDGEPTRQQLGLCDRAWIGRAGDDVRSERTGLVDATEGEQRVAALELADRVGHRPALCTVAIARGALLRPRQLVDGHGRSLDDLGVRSAQQSDQTAHAMQPARETGELVASDPRGRGRTRAAITLAPRLRVVVEPASDLAERLQRVRDAQSFELPIDLPGESSFQTSAIRSRSHAPSAGRPRPKPSATAAPTIAVRRIVRAGSRASARASASMSAKRRAGSRCKPRATTACSQCGTAGFRPPGPLGRAGGCTSATPSRADACSRTTSRCELGCTGKLPYNARHSVAQKAY